MALDNVTWGSEHIRGELLKLGIRVSKRTIQKVLRQVRGPRPWGQIWSPSLSNATPFGEGPRFLSTVGALIRALVSECQPDLSQHQFKPQVTRSSLTRCWGAFTMNMDGRHEATDK